MKTIVFKIVGVICILMVFVNCTEIQNKAINEEQLILVDTIPLKLVNGEKWKANAETAIGMQQIESILKKFEDLKRRDYKNLAAILSKETSAIIKSCNMTGEAHDQLHLVLVPILDEIIKLKEDLTLADKNTAFKNIETMVDTYNQYFK